MHKLITWQQNMEPDQITSRNKNPLSSLATTQTRPPKVNTKTPEQHFPLMKLLPELRIRIYECVFADLIDSLTPRSLSTVQSIDDNLRRRLKGFLAPLHASRALRSEAIEVYCLSAKTRLATLRKTTEDIYEAINVLGEVPNWTILMEALALELVILKLENMLLVMKAKMSDGEEKRG
jgi:hypothetical protein